MRRCEDGTRDRIIRMRKHRTYRSCALAQPGSPCSNPQKEESGLKMSRSQDETRVHVYYSSAQASHFIGHAQQHRNDFVPSTSTITGQQVILQKCIANHLALAYEFGKKKFIFHHSIVPPYRVRIVINFLGKKKKNGVEVMSLPLTSAVTIN